MYMGITVTVAFYCPLRFRPSRLVKIITLAYCIQYIVIVGLALFARQQQVRSYMPCAAICPANLFDYNVRWPVLFRSRLRSCEFVRITLIHTYRCGVFLQWSGARWTRCSDTREDELIGRSVVDTFYSTPNQSPYTDYETIVRQRNFILFYFIAR